MPPAPSAATPKPRDDSWRPSMNWAFATTGVPTGTAGAAVVGSRPPADHPAAARRGLAGRGRGQATASRRGMQLDVVSSGIDWFELHGAVDFGDGQRASLPAAAGGASRAATTFVTLGDGSSACCRRSGCALRDARRGSATPDGDRIRFKRSQVALLDALLAAQPAVDVRRDVRARRDELRAFERHRSRSIRRASFSGTLREYQREALGWFDVPARSASAAASPTTWASARPSGARAARARGASASANGRALAVARRRAAVAGLQLEQEAARFAPEAARARLHRRRRADSARRFGEHDLVLTTYGTLRRDARLLTDDRVRLRRSSTRRRRSRTPRPRRRRRRGCCARGTAWR